jgi:tetratricopeptide (TPR) repeat protein
MRASRIVVTFCVSLIAATAFGSWYDDYNAGIKAVQAGNWTAVVDKMTAAINERPKESNRERAYGTIFINYHPYYYRGVANLNLGKYQQAISDLETATGIGPENLGTIDQLLQMAKTQAGSGTPAVVERPVVQPPPVQQPPTPVIDPALRSRAQAALNQARQKVTAAQQRNAGAPQAAQALQQYTEINTRYANAKSNDDLESVIAMTDNVMMLADAVTAPATIAVPPPTPSTTRPGQATEIVLADYRRRVRQALESYFNGDFDVAARSFDRLTDEMDKNAWLWAFLGASLYSQYAFEADERYRTSALEAFRKAKRLRRWNGGLPSRYFSRRIRNAFEQAG